MHISPLQSNLRSSLETSGQQLDCSVSDESVAPFNADTAAMLHAKHPSSTVGAEPLPDPVQSFAEYFSTLQLGMEVSGDCEATVHGARRFLDNMWVLWDNWVLVKPDFSNAFNSLHRRTILDAIATRVPHLYQYCFSAYAAHQLAHF